MTQNQFHARVSELLRTNPGMSWAQAIEIVARDAK